MDERSFSMDTSIKQYINYKEHINQHAQLIPDIEDARFALISLGIMKNYDDLNLFAQAILNNILDINKELFSNLIHYGDANPFGISSGWVQLLYTKDLSLEQKLILEDFIEDYYNENGNYSISISQIKDSVFVKVKVIYNPYSKYNKKGNKYVSCGI